MHEEGIRVFPYNADTPEDTRRVLKMEVDGAIISDPPADGCHVRVPLKITRELNESRMTLFCLSTVGLVAAQSR